VTESEVYHLKLENPEWASQRGLSILHFMNTANDQREKSLDEQWMMLSKAWGMESGSIVETDLSSLSPFLQEQAMVR
jgi:hypothetical protein